MSIPVNFQGPGLISRIAYVTNQFLHLLTDPTAAPRGAVELTHRLSALQNPLKSE
jgi:hypothetical protein